MRMVCMEGKEGLKRRGVVWTGNGLGMHDRGGEDACDGVVRIRIQERTSDLGLTQASGFW
jgi:hypothetical protein